MRNPLATLSDSYRRWRHSRGFGVHSPFAYRIVTEALHPRHGYAYYLENDARLSSADTAEERRARALFRLTVLLRNEYGSDLRVWMAPGCPRPWHTAVRLAGARLAASPAGAQCLVEQTQGGAAADTDKLRVDPTSSPSIPVSPSSPSMTGRLTLAGRHWRIVITGREMADTEYILP